MLHIHHNTQPLPISKTHEAVAVPARQPEVARKLVLTREQFAAMSGIGQGEQAIIEKVGARQRPEAQANHAATKQPWVSPGSYLPASSDSFRVH